MEESGAVLLVASGGGHLRQLIELEPRLPLAGARVWATPHSALGDALADLGKVVYLRYNGPRSVFGVVRNAFMLVWKLKSLRVNAIVSTGANHALAAYPIAILKRAPFYFIESAARVQSVSMTGKILSRLPRVRPYRQYPIEKDKRWQYAGSVFEGFQRIQVAESNPRRRLRVVVTVGAMPDAPFDRMIEACWQTIPADAIVTWQIGPSQFPFDECEPERFLAAEVLKRRISNADIVIAHAGAGSALTCLSEGKIPILVPRRRTYGEHVDDHQGQIASFLESRGLAVVAEPDQLSAELLRSVLTLRCEQTKISTHLRIQ